MNRTDRLTTDDEPISCGVDLGGTKVVVALVKATGEIVAREIIRGHRGLSEDEIVTRIAASARRLLPRASDLQRLAGIGVGTTGHVNFHRGVLISSSNLPGFSNYPLAERISKALGTKVILDNDANAQAYAEYRFGAGRGFDNVVFVTVSTGLGAGIVLGGRLYRGATGTAGEIGHTVVNPEGRIQCGCGNYGCLMAHTSGLTLPEIVADKLRNTDAETGIDFSGRKREEITGELIKTGLDRGDALCTNIVLEYGYYLGLGLHNLVQTINPGVIVLGGGLTSWGPLYLARVRETFYRLVAMTIDEPPEIRLSELGSDAAVIGAAALAFTAEEETA
jgi:glucokinase